jgi:hypothetical protein
MFNLLYSAGEDQEKLLALFDLMMHEDTPGQNSNQLETIKKPTDSLLVSRMVSLVSIPSLLIANIVEQ